MREKVGVICWIGLYVYERGSKKKKKWEWFANSMFLLSNFMSWVRNGGIFIMQVIWWIMAFMQPRGELCRACLDAAVCLETLLNLKLPSAIFFPPPEHYEDRHAVQPWPWPSHCCIHRCHREDLRRVPRGWSDLHIRKACSSLPVDGVPASVCVI